MVRTAVVLVYVGLSSTLMIASGLNMLKLIGENEELASGVALQAAYIATQNEVIDSLSRRPMSCVRPFRV